jgi:Flp pilus assembly protein TadG
MIPGTRRRERGQALPEFALIAPIFFLVLFGIIQLGFLFAGQNGMSNAAREAARYASTLPTPDLTVAGNGSCSAAGNAKAVYDQFSQVNLRQYIPGFLSGNLTSAGGPACGAATLAGTGTGVGYCVVTNPDSSFALRVRVSVLYRHPLFIPLVGQIFSSTNTWQLQAIEEMRVEGPDRATNGGFSSCP